MRSFISTIGCAFAIVVLTASAGAACAADSAEIRPFRIAVPDDVLVDLQSRLERTRWPDEIEGAGWGYGVELAYMKELVDHWRTKYDWRAEERKLNAIPQFVTTIDGVDLHFWHIRSKHAGALPLVITHGWPGSVVEFLKIIGPLTDPTTHGGRAEDAFHVVCPSLPGFGFSGKPKVAGWSSARMAAAIRELMARLGYEKYGAQGGDWGSGVSTWLANNDSQHVVGAHITFLGSGIPQIDDPWQGVTTAERERYEARRKELEQHFGYGAIQGSRPQTIGYALNDSPAGLAAWIVDKFWAWSDHGGDLDNSFTKDELLTNVMVYWVTETPASAARIYFERGSVAGGAGKQVRVPIGVAMFPKEIGVPPRKWAEARYPLVHWTEMPRGGHFAAMEQPELLVGDIRKFFAQVRNADGE
ncbi:MAG: alpha/beta fold hydrolase [Planctomycetaceae bacterium]|nr:alpha/beta fold hydrolase [Planctomycetaceae bacterium]